MKHTATEELLKSFEGQRVTSIAFFATIDIMLFDPPSHLAIRLQCPFTLDSHEVEPLDYTTITPVFALFGKTLSSIKVEDSTLLVDFEGELLRCQSHDQYEAWHAMEVDTGNFVFALPGGGIDGFFPNKTS